MNGLSVRVGCFSVFAFMGAGLLSSCGVMSMEDIYDSHPRQAVYTDAYAPNTPVSQEYRSVPRIAPSSQKVSAKEITQTAAPTVSTTHRVSNSQQVPLSAPTVE